MQVQAIFLDLDGTLLDYDSAAWARTVRAVCTAVHRPGDGLDPETLFSVYTGISAGYFRAAEASGEQVADGHAIWRGLWRQALAECGCTEESTADAAVAAYDADRRDRYRLFGDVLPTLARLREHVAALVLITNGPGSTQRHKATATGLTDLLDAVIISGEVGTAKPGPAIFALAAAAVDVPLAAAWHVGDSLASDIAGARMAGLGAGVWLNRNDAGRPARQDADPATSADARPDYEITSLSELPALLADRSA